MNHPGYVRNIYICSYIDVLKLLTILNPIQSLLRAFSVFRIYDIWLCINDSGEAYMSRNGVLVKLYKHSVFIALQLRSLRARWLLGYILFDIVM